MSTTLQEGKKPRECGIDNCKSKRFIEDNGLFYCKKCGQQQEGIQTQQDEDDFGTQGRTSRKRRESQEKVSQILQGQSATLLYLQCYQLIIWKQCHALVNTVGLDPRLEEIVKSLWACRLQLVKDTADANAEEETLFSSQAASATETELDHEEEGRKWKAGAKRLPSLIETLALLYLGTVLLRLPVSIGDYHRWAVREVIPYIRAVRLVPTVMKQKLPAEYIKALDTTSPLEPDHLRKAIHKVSLFYTHHFELHWPSLNAVPIVLRYIHDLALPITLHHLTLSVSAILNVDFAFPSPKARQRVSSLPELSLISALVVATKLYHPFEEDKNPRHARSLTDNAALAIDWNAWVSAQKDQDISLNPLNTIPRGSEINITERDIMQMGDEQLDQYMDYYEQTFVDESRSETKGRGLPQQLLDMFPTNRLDGTSPTPYNYREQAKIETLATKETLQTVMASLKLRPITSKQAEDADSVARIGSFYKRYRGLEELEEGPARLFHEKVAALVGIKVESLLTAVGQLERKLVVWQEKKAKEEGV